MKAALILLLALAGSGAARACPEKIPSGMRAVTVAEAVTVNTLGLSIVQVESRESAPAVFDRVEKEWKAAGFAVRRNQAEGWQVLAAASDKCMTTLQLVQRSGAFGYLAVNRMSGKVSKPAALPAPPGATLLSTVESNDDGRHGVTAMFAATQSVQTLAEFYKQRLESDKWTAVKAVGTADSNGQFADAAVSGQRGRERIEVVIVRDEGSKVVINMATAL